MNIQKGKTTIHFLAERGQRTQMMSFIIQTENGHLIVIDGGNKEDTEFFHGYLQGLAGVKPVIDLWILTHAHSDHTDVFYEMLRRYSEDFELKVLAYNFPSYEFVDTYEKPEAHTVEELSQLLPTLREKGIVPQIVHEGDVLDVDGVTFECLYEPDAAFTDNAVNNSSLVLRMESQGQSVLFLGDLGVEGGNKTMAQCPPEKLRCDFVQMAHHGQHGVTEAFYQSCAPKACLWSTPVWLWNNDAGEGYNTYIWQTVTVREWMEKLGVKHHFVNKDGVNVVTLPYAF